MTDTNTDPIRLLGRLLGPAEPEITCEECFAQLDMYVELELAGQDADEQVPGMRAHLQGCPACAEEHDALHAFIADPEPWREGQNVSLSVRSATATITCPACGTKARETMPANACQNAYVCTGCGERLTPKAGDCCVFCSYADTACPPRQDSA